MTSSCASTVLSLATNAFWYTAGERKQATEYHRIVAFGPQAERVQDLVKGKQLFVEGRLQTRKFEKDGETRYITEVIANRVEQLGAKSAEASDSPDSEESDA